MSKKKSPNSGQKTGGNNSSNNPQQKDQIKPAISSTSNLPEALPLKKGIKVHWANLWSAVSVLVNLGILVATGYMYSSSRSDVKSAEIQYKNANRPHIRIKGLAIDTVRLGEKPAVYYKLENVSNSTIEILSINAGFVPTYKDVNIAELPRVNELKNPGIFIESESDGYQIAGGIVTKEMYDFLNSGKLHFYITFDIDFINVVTKQKANYKLDSTRNLRKDLFYNENDPSKIDTISLVKELKRPDKYLNRLSLHFMEPGSAIRE